MKNLNLPSLNRSLLAGYATGDAVLRHTPGGVPVASFALAYNRRYKSGDEWKTDASFIPCVAWNERAEQAAERVRKGTAVLIEGHLQSRSWETDDGKTRTVVEIVVDRLQVLEKRKAQAENPAKAPMENEVTPSAAEQAALDAVADMDDVPF